MEKSNRTWGVLDLAMPCLALAWFVGLMTVLAPCGVKDDGSYMTCHYAGQVLRAIALALTALGICHFLLPEPGQKQGLSVGMLIFCVLALLVPGRLIPLCMMPMMHCRQVMAPASLALSVIQLILAAVDLFLQQKKRRHP